MIFLLKFTAMLLFFGGFICAGRFFASHYLKKAELIRDLMLMLSVIKTRLRYDCLPVPELLRVLCGTDKLKNLHFISDCAERLGKGEAFPVAWKNSVESDGEFCVLLDNCKVYLIQLGEDIGATDVEGQLGWCEYYEQFFERELAIREENGKKYAKLYPSLGAMLGIAAAIIII